MEATIYDVAIIGLGPAGATLARLLPPGLSVLALDRKEHAPETLGFHKPCGGLLAPDAQKALARQGLALPVEVLVSPQIFSVQTVDIPTGRIQHYPRSYMNMDRYRFDLWLRSLIPDQVDIRTGARCTGVAGVRGGFVVTWKENGKECSAKARWLVGADGAMSQVRRHFYPKMKQRRYTAIQQWFSAGTGDAVYTCFFDPASTDCYAWGLNKDGYYIFGGAFAPQGAWQSYKRLCGRAAEIAPVSGPAVKTEACQIIRPAPLDAFACGENGVFLVGEAAGFVSPSSLEGISYALESAHALANVLGQGGNPNAAYWQATARLRWKLHAKQLKCPPMYQPALRAAVMASGLNSLPCRQTGKTNRRNL